MVRNAYQAIMSPERQRGVSTAAVCTLLLPPMLYFAARNRPIRGVLFFVGLLISLRYILRLHLGEPFVRTSTSALSSPDGAISQLPDSRITLKFPVDLKALAVYVLKKKQDSGLNVTFQHICVKAVAMALVEYKSMQGNIHFGSFYKNKTNHVNMTLSADISANETVMIKINDVDMKPVEYIANEVHERTRKLRADALEKKNKQVEQKSSGSILEMVKGVLFSPILMARVQELKVYIASDLGISVPSLGITAYPQGHASVMSSPTENRQIDEITVNTTVASAAPITVTIGGIKEYNYKFIRKETELTHETGMMISVVMDTRCASLSECNKFCATLQKFLDDPTELEK
jgi:pyruvate/2-oxoglutarate dehydrogenase complex dihydrolipoamide acyltransferase (E2) component